MYAITYRRLGVAIVIIAILGMTGQAFAAGEIVTDELAASSFDWYYHFETGLKPGETNLDGNLAMDWRDLGDVTYTIGGGLLSYVTTTSSAAYSISEDTGEAWDVAGMNYTDGFTAEFCVRVNSIDPDEDAAFGFFAGDASPSGSNIAFGIRQNSTSWGPWLADKAYGLNNLGAFHTFRVVQEPLTETYSFYRDGVLLTQGEVSPYVLAGWDRIWFGDGSSGATGGSVDIDYVGFHPGDYAPVGFTNGIPTADQLATKNSATFTYKYECNILPSFEDLEPNGQDDFGIMSNGIDFTTSGDGRVLLDTSSYAGYFTYFDGGINNTETALWSTQDFNLNDDGYTIELRAKITAEAAEGNAVLSVVACPSDQNEYSLLNIGLSGTGFDSGLELDASDNSDDFHIFRLVVNPLIDGGRYYVYRDGVLLTDNEGIVSPSYRADRNALYFGDIGGAGGGAFELDYIRFMKGAFAPGEAVVVPGDTDDDGDVDAVDAQTVAEHWGAPTTNGAQDGDFDNDGVVGPADASILAANWGYGTSEAASGVPEPSVLVMLLGLLSAWLVARRRP